MPYSIFIGERPVCLPSHFAISDVRSLNCISAGSALYCSGTMSRPVKLLLPKDSSSVVDTNGNSVSGLGGISVCHAASINCRRRADRPPSDAGTHTRQP
jgi:hypothetical protein